MSSGRSMRCSASSAPGVALVGENAVDEFGEIAAWKGVADDFGGFGGADVALAVADQKTLFAHDPVMLHQVEDHAGLWLAPIAVAPIGRHRGVDVIGAVADVVDPRALCRELL